MSLQSCCRTTCHILRKHHSKIRLRSRFSPILRRCYLGSEYRLSLRRWLIESTVIFMITHQSTNILMNTVLFTIERSNIKRQKYTKYHKSLYRNLKCLSVCVVHVGVMQWAIISSYSRSRTRQFNLSSFTFKTDSMLWYIHIDSKTLG